MFVYTPPSWHPVLFVATPSQCEEVSGEGRAAASSAGSFIHGPPPPFSFSCQQWFSSARFPQEFDSVSKAGMGKKRPRDIPCVAAIWCLSPPPAVPPTHKFTHGWSRASSNALGITTQRQTDSASPGTCQSLSRNPKRSAGNPHWAPVREHSDNSSQGPSVNTFGF